jgi:hypothetical protein
LVDWFSWRRSLKDFQCIFTPLIAIPMERMVTAFSLSRLDTSPPKENLYQVWLKLHHVCCGFAKKVKNAKVYRQTDRQTKTCHQKSSFKLSGQVS